jgi:hypothetical protein
MNEDELHQLLRQHPARLPLPSAFEREVWTRIAADEGRSMLSPLDKFFQRLLTSFGRPAVAFVTIAIFGIGGAVIAVAMFRVDNSKRGELAYLETVNPLVRNHLNLEK